jgi:hypothetical protein
LLRLLLPSLACLLAAGSAVLRFKKQPVLEKRLLAERLTEEGGQGKRGFAVEELEEEEEEEEKDQFRTRRTGVRFMFLYFGATTCTEKEN